MLNLETQRRQRHPPGTAVLLLPAVTVIALSPGKAPAAGVRTDQCAPVQEPCSLKSEMSASLPCQRGPPLHCQLSVLTSKLSSSLMGR